MVIHPRHADDLQDYMASVRKFPRLTAEHERTLFSEYRRTGDTGLRRQLIESHLRLVPYFARRFRAFGVALADLISEGNLALLDAVEKFNPQFGIRFSTYAAWWIRRVLRRATHHLGRTVRIPERVNTLAIRWSSAGRQLEAQWGRPATEAEISAHLHLGERQAKKLNSLLPALQNRTTVDIDADGRSATIADPRFTPSEQVAITRELKNMLKLLPPLGAEILSRRFGLKGEAPQSLEQIGRAVQMARESVRQIEIASIKTLRGWLETNAVPAACLR